MSPRRRTLTRDRVLRAALDLVDREGVDALTMRRLGRDLGVEAMSLYGHVASKDDLIDGVVEQVFRQMPLVAPGPGRWEDRLREYAAAYRKVLLDHPNTVQLVSRRRHNSEGIVAFVESALRELTALGLDPVRAERVLRVIANFTLGHVTEQVGDEARTRQDALRAGARPPPVDPAHDEAFELGIDFIVAGIDHLLPARPATTPAASPAER
ncbi:MAG TPA: TetR/AcrR family transcriptional regulator C-terminal domain-containing protein [Acidimicrobiales bacterium]|jgi:AcrR family transcriptional regulator